jgi:hypothetical protein
VSSDARAIWPIYLSTRVGVLAVGLLGLFVVGYREHAPPWRFYENDALNLPARWDAGWYLGIAMEGYVWDRAFSDTQQNIAFFPLYPLLMRLMSVVLGGHFLWAGVIISLVAFFLALVYVFRLSRLWLSDTHALAAVTFLAAYPFAVFFSAPYTESIFLLTIAATCYHFEQNTLWKAAIWGLLAGVTRPNGCLLSVPLALIALRRWREQPVMVSLTRLAVAAMPGIGMVLYSAYIYSLTGNPLQWAASNAAWGRVYKDYGTLVREHAEAIGSGGFYLYAVSQNVDLLQMAAVALALVAVVPVFRRFGAVYATLILANVLPPLAVGGFLSMGRVTSVLFPVFIWLGAAVPPAARTGVIVGLAMLQAICAIGFFTWRPPY